MRFLTILLVLMIAVFGAATTEASAKVVGPKPKPQRMVSLWGIKPQGSKKTIGQVWASLPTYKYTCYAQKMTYQNSGKSFEKAVFWPAFKGPSTMVSSDIQCLLTEDPMTRKKLSGLLKEPNLYRYITGEPFEDEGLVGFSQYRAFSSQSPALICRAKGIGVLQLETDTYVELYYQNTIFQANNLKSVFGIRSWVSRDMTCTSDNSVIAKWKADPNWTYMVWAEPSY